MDTLRPSGKIPNISFNFQLQHLERRGREWVVGHMAHMSDRTKVSTTAKDIICVIESLCLCAYCHLVLLWIKQLYSAVMQNNGVDDSRVQQALKLI